MARHARTSVEDLVRSAAGGSTDAECELCLRFLPALRAFASSRLSNAESQRELVQDSMLAFLEAARAEKIAEPKHASAFLLGVCRNLASERVRTAARRQRLLEHFGPSLATAVEQPPVTQVRPELLEDCMTQLTQRARAIIRRSYVDDHSTTEIAAALEMRETNVRVARHRALKALRGCLEQPTSYERARAR